MLPSLRAQTAAHAPQPARPCGNTPRGLLVPMVDVNCGVDSDGAHQPNTRMVNGEWRRLCLKTTFRFLGIP
eukprot:361194-Chlamydomonas_euryale.AAC.1